MLATIAFFPVIFNSLLNDHPSSTSGSLNSKSFVKSIKRVPDVSKHVTRHYACEWVLFDIGCRIFPNDKLITNGYFDF
jgi:hypothetical protein